MDNLLKNNKLSNVDDEWENFMNDDYNIDNIIKNNNIISKANKIPKASPLYISTKTKIAYFNQNFDLLELFWKIPIIKYQQHKIGILKKQIKINLKSKEEIIELEKILENNENYLYCNQILKVDEHRKNAFKDIRKINIGICTKDLLTIKKKNKGAFYNCFVVIIRIKKDNNFKEINIKLFNTGQLEIPGIQDDNDLYKALDLFLNIIQPFLKQKIFYLKEKIRNVLINSNFSCNFYIDRNILYNCLKKKYNIDVIYDPCSYPGIQCKYYFNDYNDIGICKCKKKCKKKDGTCKEISFMIFRTGSILIVGNCSEEIIYKIYNFILTILNNEYNKICISNNVIIKKKKKYKKKKILF